MSPDRCGRHDGPVATGPRRLGDTILNTRDLIIVGAGPAGMSAALAAHRAGVQVTLIDENAAVGGQIYRQPPATIRTQPLPSADAQRGAELRTELADLITQIEVLTDTAVWASFPGNQLAVLRDGGWQMLAAKQLIFATGAYEFVPPFPGWTTPGVMTPGAAQSMVKTMGVLPGKRVVVAGTGPFLLVVANQLRAAGAEVVAVVEAARRRRFLRHGLGLLSQRELFRQGKDYLDNLRQARIPLHWGNVVTEAYGKDQLEAISISRCNESGQPIGEPRRVKADTLCVGYGFIPRTELAGMSGCEMRYTAEQGGWVADVDETFETSVKGVRVAGDSGGIAGAVVAELEGSLAGFAAARDLDQLSETDYNQATASISTRWRKLQRFRHAIDQIYQVPRCITDLAKPDTTVCRCEELTRADVETGIEFGGQDLRTLKVTTRLGMGPCQGKMCWPTAARLIAQKTGKTVSECGPVNVRPPVVPVMMSDLLHQPGTTCRSGETTNSSTSDDASSPPRQESAT